MNNTIPQEIKDKIEQEYPVAMCHYSTGEHRGMFGMCDSNYYEREAVKYGYSLALPEISALKAEVERLKEALEKIVQMKRESGETSDTYVFNRCWHIATETLNTPL